MNERIHKNKLDPFQPHELLVELETSSQGSIHKTATVFLTNRECPFRCVMCDLWKNTLDDTVPQGAIAHQVDWAIQQLAFGKQLQNPFDKVEPGHDLPILSTQQGDFDSAPVTQVKLYNCGNFFDVQAIPTADHESISKTLNRTTDCLDVQNLVVENHPSLCNTKCLEFRSRLECDLEIAMGLESIHPKVLPQLQKSMSLEDFDRATEFLRKHDIAVRAFILLNPPFIDYGRPEAVIADDVIEWALRSVEHAFSIGVNCCTVIPTRAETTAMHDLVNHAKFREVSLSVLEDFFDSALANKPDTQRIFVDTWDAQRFTNCEQCVSKRVARLESMNLTQTPIPRVECTCDSPVLI